MTATLPNPYEAALSLTYRCNLACRFCYERRWRDAAMPELAPEQWISILRELEQMQVLTLQLLGGEPLVSPAFAPLVRELTGGPMRFGVISNGTLIDEAAVRMLAASGRCDYVQLSLDGPETLHDRLRGEGTFRKTVNALRRLAAAGIPVRINSALGESAAAALPEFLALLESLPVTTYRLNPLSGDGLPEERLTPETLAAAANHVIAHEAELSKLGAGSFPLVLRRWLTEPEEDDDATGRCFRSHVRINLRPDGGVTPCSDVRTPVCGYAGREPLAAIWRGAALTGFRNRSRRNTPLPAAECGQCRWRARCRRYCPVANPAELCLKRLWPRLRGKGWEK